MLRPIMRPVLRPVLRSVFDPTSRGGGGDPLLEAVLALYANGEQGALYYFTEDFAGLYQDAVGTNPVTAVGQPVGLMLDRRFGLARGTEVIADTGLDAPENWQVLNSSIVVDGMARWQDAPNASWLQQTITPLVEGRFYEFIFRIDSISQGGIRAYAGVGGGQSATATTVGVHRAIIVAGGTNNPRLQCVSTTTASVSSFSVREVPGNHASQATATARPTLSSGPLRIDYDGVDDYLRTVFPALGSDVTIARSIPGVGAQILTGQTIAAGNWDDNVDSCATLVIDRALTPDETALVTAFLNQQAGV